MEFVKELAKHVQVDVFGKCGNLECNKDFKEKCYDMLSSDYKFYLAFENSNCDSYITEKLFENALGSVMLFFYLLFPVNVLLLG